MGVETVFPAGGGGNSGFFQVAAKSIFSGWGQEWGNFILPVRKQENNNCYMENTKFKIQGVESPPLPPPTSMRDCMGPCPGSDSKVWDEKRCCEMTFSWKSTTRALERSHFCNEKTFTCKSLNGWISDTGKHCFMTFGNTAKRACCHIMSCCLRFHFKFYVPYKQ